VSVADVETADFLTARGKNDGQVDAIQEVEHEEQVDKKSDNREILSP